MHFANSLLNPIEHNHVVQDEVNRLHDILHALEQCELFQISSTFDHLQYLLRYVDRFTSDLDFRFNTTVHARIASVLLATYTSPVFNPIIPMATKLSLLSCCAKLLKKKKDSGLVLLSYYVPLNAMGNTAVAGHGADNSTVSSGTVSGVVASNAGSNGDVDVEQPDTYWSVLFAELLGLSRRERISITLPTASSASCTDEDGSDDISAMDVQDSSSSSSTECVSVSRSDVANQPVINQLATKLSSVIHNLRHHYQLPCPAPTPGDGDDAHTMIPASGTRFVMMMSSPSSTAAATADTASSLSPLPTFSTTVIVSVYDPTKRDDYTAQRAINSDALVTAAMSKLVVSPTDISQGNHLSNLHSFEGLLMLLLGLPTNYPNYHVWLNKWLSIWLAIPHNSYWNLCWLTLFTRVRKYVHQHAVSAALFCDVLRPALYVKMREVMRLPGISTNDMKATGGGRSFALQKTEYPLVIPAYYNLMPLNSEAHLVCANKISKLIYFCALITSVNAPSLGTEFKTAAATFATPPDIINLSPDISIPGVDNSTGTIPGDHPRTNVPEHILRLYSYPGLTQSASISPEIAEFCVFLQSVRSFFYPSNTGEWTTQLAYFIASFMGEVARHVGRLLSGVVVQEGLKSGSISEAGEKSFEALSCRIQALELASLSATAGTSATNAQQYPQQQMDSVILSIKFICGNIFPLLLEGLYGKHPMMVQLCSTSLRNICAIDPDLGSLFMHISLKALGTESVNQAHQAPAALGALSICLRQLFYPDPVALVHLRQLMELSLAGLDSNDANKTGAAMNVYSIVFSWLPIKTKYTIADFLPANTSGSAGSAGGSVEAPYLNLLRGNDHNTMDMRALQSRYSPFIAEFGSFMEQFCSLFLDKVLLLLEGKEQRQKKSASGAKAAFNDNGLAESIRLLFGAMKTPTLKLKCVRKICEYMATTGANSATVSVNARKDCGLLFESLCEADNHTNSTADAAGTLDVVMTTLLGVELVGAAAGTAMVSGSIVDHQELQQQQHHCGTLSELQLAVLEATTPDKLAFLLTCVGGAFRLAGAHNLLKYAGLIRDHFCRNPSFLYHADKGVRKAIGKLTRDYIRGCTAIYPLHCQVESPLSAVAMFRERHQTQQQHHRHHYHQHGHLRSVFHQHQHKQQHLRHQDGQEVSASAQPQLHLVRWNIPSAACYATITDILECCLMAANATAAADTASEGGLMTEVTNETSLLTSGVGGGASGSTPPPPATTVAATITATASTSSAASDKKAAERIVIQLNYMHRLIRGCSELFGNGTRISSDPEEAATSSDRKRDNEGENKRDDYSARSTPSGVDNCHLVGAYRHPTTTGEQKVKIKKLLSLRFELFMFLEKLHSTVFSATGPTATATATADLCYDVSISALDVIFGSGSGSGSGGSSIDISHSATPTTAAIISNTNVLANNTQFNKLWCKLLSSLMRCSTLTRMKTFNSTRRYYTVVKRYTSSAIVKYMTRVAKCLHRCSAVTVAGGGRAVKTTTSSEKLSIYTDVDYWHGINLTVDMLQSRLYMQHIKHSTLQMNRLALGWFSHSVLDQRISKNNISACATDYQLQASGTTASVGASADNVNQSLHQAPLIICPLNPYYFMYMRLLKVQLINTLCVHAYDDVRSYALRCFRGISSKIPTKQLTECVLPLFYHLSRSSLPIGDGNSLDASDCGLITDVVGNVSRCDADTPPPAVDKYYPLIMSTCSILSFDHVVSRVWHRHQILPLFLSSLLSSPAMLQNCLVLPDKRLVATESVAKLFVKYIDAWAQVDPRWCNNSNDQSLVRNRKMNKDIAAGRNGGDNGGETTTAGGGTRDLVTFDHVVLQAISMCGTAVHSGRASTATSAVATATDTAAVASAAAVGLRMQVFSTFCILNLHAHPALKPSTRQAVIQWMQQTLSTGGDRSSSDCDGSLDSSSSSRSIDYSGMMKNTQRFPIPIKKVLVTVLQKQSWYYNGHLLQQQLKLLPELNNTTFTVNAHIAQVLTLIHQEVAQNKATAAESSGSGGNGGASGGGAIKAQWSYGIPNVLSANQHAVRGVIPRTGAGDETDYMHFSATFRRANAHLWCNYANELLVYHHDRLETAVDNCTDAALVDARRQADWLRQILFEITLQYMPLTATCAGAGAAATTTSTTDPASAPSTTLAASTEEDMFASNVACAELFAGFGRAIINYCSQQQQVAPVDASRLLYAQALQSILCEYFVYKVDSVVAVVPGPGISVPPAPPVSKMSVTNTKEWAQGIYFIYCGSGGNACYTGTSTGTGANSSTATTATSGFMDCRAYLMNKMNLIVSSSVVSTTSATAMDVVSFTADATTTITTATTTATTTTDAAVATVTASSSVVLLPPRSREGFTSQSRYLLLCRALIAADSHRELFHNDDNNDNNNDNNKNGNGIVADTVLTRFCQIVMKEAQQPLQTNHSGDGSTCNGNSSVSYASVKSLLQSPTTLLSPFRTTREELGVTLVYILGMLETPLVENAGVSGVSNVSEPTCASAKLASSCFSSILTRMFNEFALCQWSPSATITSTAIAQMKTAEGLFSSMDAIGSYITTGKLPSATAAAIVGDSQSGNVVAGPTAVMNSGDSNVVATAAEAAELVLLQHAHFKSLLEIVGGVLETALLYFNFHQYYAFVPWLLSLILSGVAELSVDSSLSKSLTDLAQLLCNNIKECVADSHRVGYNSSSGSVIIGNSGDTASVGSSSDGTTSVGIVTALMRVCEMHMLYTSSIHVRKTAIACYIALFVNNAVLLTAQEKKDYRAVLLLCAGVNTPAGVKSNMPVPNYSASNGSPDIISLVQYGLVGYMTVRPTTELTVLATGYVKNLQLIYDRLRKLRSAGGDISADGTLITTVLSACSLVMMAPLDVPNYLPSLLEKLLQLCTISHSTSTSSSGSSNNITASVTSSAIVVTSSPALSPPSPPLPPSDTTAATAVATAVVTATATTTNTATTMTFSGVKDWIKHNVLEFKRTHQDRWNDIQFRKLFTSEQWEELKGSGVAATYFA